MFSSVLGSSGGRNDFLNRVSLGRFRPGALPADRPRLVDEAPHFAAPIDREQDYERGLDLLTRGLKPSLDDRPG